jgi:CheY-like chemotaxis protein
MTGQESRPANILVVDDTPAHLKLLAILLQEAGFRVRPVLSGAEALAAAIAEAPDLVLLYVDMPEMDGHEVCRRFKANPDLADVPVLFISALADRRQNRRSRGGVGFSTQPSAEEVWRRHPGSSPPRLDLGRATARTDEPSNHATSRLRRDLVHMLAHGMRSPLAGRGGPQAQMIRSPPRVSRVRRTSAR